MRKLYILRENEEDGAVADALLAAGRKAEEAELENPVCPHCGEDILLAYAEGDQYEVVTWTELDESDDLSDADQWFLICSDFRCQYEEQVERVAQPMGAILFDLQQSHFALDGSCGIFSMYPADLLKLIQQLQALRQQYPKSRKLVSLLEEAEFQREYQMEELRTWVSQLAQGERIRFEATDQVLTGTFLAASGDRFLLQAEPDATLLGIELQAVEARHLCLGEPEPYKLNGEAIVYNGIREMVVVRGYHLRLLYVDRIGMHHVQTWDAITAAALGLSQLCPGSWEGAFRRTDIEAWYDSKKLLRVKGHWVEVYGHTWSDELPAVVTRDPAVAEALGLTRERTWRDDESVTSYTGTVTWEQVEEQDELRIYHDEPSSTGSVDQDR